MQRLDRVSPRMRYRLGGLVDRHTGIICDCGTEFVARRDAPARCPACGRVEQAADQATAAASEIDMTTTHRVRGIARLVQSVHAMNAEADRLADEIERHARRISDGMQVTRSVVDQVKQAA